MKKKIVVFHDHFLYAGGGERLVTLLAKGIDADIVTGFFNPDSLNPADLGFTNIFQPLTQPIFAQGFRHLKMMWVFRNKTKHLDEYDTVIFSGNCLEALPNLRKAKRVYYCHSPPRYLYDKYEHHLAKKKGIKKLLFKLFVPFLRKQYEKSLTKLDAIIVNSQTVHDRLKHYTGFDSTIVYPPIDTQYFSPGESEGFYLSVARVTDIKRVNMIAKAFCLMPDKQLVIKYNPSDPGLQEIRDIVEGKKNISLVKIEKDEINQLMARCRATLYIPRDEDFGMSPVESMSAGKPVIGVAEGGLLETIIPNKTGILLDPDFSIEDICDAVEKLDQERCDAMREDCIVRAKKFNLSNFIDGVSSVLEKTERK